MPRVLVVVTLLLLIVGPYAVSTYAQQRDSTQGFLPKQHIDSVKVNGGVGIGDWLKGYPTDPPNGVLFRFDYTKLLEWLIPKKKPLIPPDCDPRNMRDWMPDTTKPDTTKIKLPV